MKKNINFLVIFSLILLLFTSCGIGKKLKDFHEPVDLRNSPLDPDERARRNIEEGRGISLGGIGTVKQLMNLVLQILCGELHLKF